MAKTRCCTSQLYGPIWARKQQINSITRASDLAFQTVGVAGRYSNRPDLLEQLRKVDAILSDGGQDDGTGAKVAADSVVRSRRLRDRFSSVDLQTMIDLYKSGTTAREVAEKFGVSLRSVKRLLRLHGVRREGRSAHARDPRGGHMQVVADRMVRADRQTATTRGGLRG